MSDVQASIEATTDGRCGRDFWEALKPALTAKARELGYALAVHGSLLRDIDLIACPWTPEAVEPRVLAEALRRTASGHYSWSMQGKEYTLAGCPGSKPHGRLGWVVNLTMDGGPYIDLAVIPPVR